VNALLLWKHPHPSLAVANYPTARRLRGIVLAFPVQPGADLGQTAPDRPRCQEVWDDALRQDPDAADSGRASRIHMALTRAAMT
jgi:hypothetical protein